jgi:pyruvate, water dikinase
MFTKNFKKLNYKDVNIAGGKGASLGEMVQSKITVPPGFVVLVDGFERFLEETDLGVEIDAVMSKIKHDNINSVEKASVKIRDMIRDEKFPKDIGDEVKKDFKKLGAKYVAVRSSATAEDSSVASWAGELESYLNVTEKNLLESVKKCWSSLFTPRAIFYRFEKNLQDQKVSVAVVVQKMVQSDVSGICFTVHPVTEDKNQIIIEAGWGLGESIVSGSITPDSYVIDKQDWLIMDINISDQKRQLLRNGEKGIKWKPVLKSNQEKQKLSGPQIIKLAKICTNIEKHYKKPQDIEWGIEKDKIYITQSRPITTLN